MPLPTIIAGFLLKHSKHHHHTLQEQPLKSPGICFLLSSAENKVKRSQTERRALVSQPHVSPPSCQCPTMRFLRLSHELLQWQVSKGDARKPLSVDGGCDVQLLQMEQTPLSVSCKSTLELQPPHRVLLQKAPAQAAGLQDGSCWAVPRMLTAALTLPSQE